MSVGRNIRAAFSVCLGARIRSSPVRPSRSRANLQTYGQYNRSDWGDPCPQSLPARFIGDHHGAASHVRIGRRPSTVVWHARYDDAHHHGLHGAADDDRRLGARRLLEAQVRQMESFGIQVNDQVYQQMRNRMGIAPYTTAGGVLVMSPIITAVIGRTPLRRVQRRDGRQRDVQAGLQRGRSRRRDFRARPAVHRPAELLPRHDGERDQSRRCCCRCCRTESFSARLAGMIDLFVVWWVFVLAIGLACSIERRTQPVAIGAVRRVRGDRARGRRRHEPFGGNALSRNKKILHRRRDRRRARRASRTPM